MPDQPKLVPVPRDGGGLANTLKVIAAMLAGAALLYLALLYGPSDNQYIRIGLWAAFFIAAAMTFKGLRDTLNGYGVRFLALPSTWMMLVVAVAGILLGFSRANEPSAGLSTFEVILIAGILLLTVVSAFGNVVRTNVIFGVVLTLVQLVFSGLLILAALVVFKSRNQNQQR